MCPPKTIALPLSFFPFFFLPLHGRHARHRSLLHISHNYIDPQARVGLLAFITGNSSLEPLLEGLFAQIHIDLSRQVLGRDRTGNMRITQIC